MQIHKQGWSRGSTSAPRGLAAVVAVHAETAGGPVRHLGGGEWLNPGDGKPRNRQMGSLCDNTSGRESWTAVAELLLGFVNMFSASCLGKGSCAFFWADVELVLAQFSLQSKRMHTVFVCVQCRIYLAENKEDHLSPLFDRFCRISFLHSGF